jgi:hypothetical protein
MTKAQAAASIFTQAQKSQERAYRKAEVADATSGEMAVIHIRIPAQLRHKAKVRAAEMEMSMTSYICDLIAHD